MPDRNPAGIPCAHCAGSHPTIADVKACGRIRQTRERAEFAALLRRPAR